MQHNTIQLLAIDLLQANPYQPREKMSNEELEDLVNSIKIHGVLEPLVVAHTPAGYQIIAGERRWRASKLANLQEVPVLIKKTSPKGMLEMAIIENLQRVNLTAIERAKAFMNLKRNFNLTTHEISERVGKSHSFVSNSFKLLKLPDAIKDGLLGKQITEGHARAISGLHDKRLMLKIYKQVLRENASVRRAEQLARIAKRETGQTRIFRPKESIFELDHKQVKIWEKKVKNYLKRQTSLTLRRTNKLTRVTFTIKGDPEETQDDLERLMSLVGHTIK